MRADARQQPTPGLHRRPALAGGRGAARRRGGSSEIVDAARRRRGARHRRLVDRRTRAAGCRPRSASGPTAPTRPTCTSTPTRPATRDIHVHVAVTVDGDHLIVDFTGSDERPNIQAWSTFGNTRGNVVSQLASLVDPTIPKNEGFFDSHRDHRPARQLREPRRGQAGLERHAPSRRRGERRDRRGDVSQVIPDRCCPQTYKFGSPRQMWGDEDPRTGRSFFDHGGEVSAGWVNGGARASTVGARWSPPTATSSRRRPRSTRGCSRTSSAAATTCTDSGGAGQWRGALRQHCSSRRCAPRPTSTSTS